MDITNQVSDTSLRTACRGGENAVVFRELLDKIGDKWSLLIVTMLEGGPLRFGALQQEVAGISQRMLTLNLRQLERDGLVTRTVFAEVPPRVEYGLTDLGRSLLKHVVPLAGWIASNAANIEAHRQQFDAAVIGVLPDSGSTTGAS